MPPKRKRKDAEPEGEPHASTSTTNAKATRSSTRLRKDAAPVTEVADDSVATIPKTAKRKKPDAAANSEDVQELTKAATKPQSSVKKSNRGRKAKNTEESKEDNDIALESGSSQTRSINAIAKIPPLPSRPYKYTPSASLELFNSYSDPDDPNVIGPEGLERLCNDAGIPIDGALTLILAWQLNCSEMAKITKDEWAKGMSTLQIDTLPVLRVYLSDLQELVVVSSGLSASKNPPSYKPTIGAGGVEYYNLERYRRYALDVKTTFSQLYGFCFGLAKAEQSRNIDMEIACAFWSVLLPPQYPIITDIIEYINEKGTYKAVNKDLWNMTYEFCQTVKPTLEGYDSESAWPTMLDSFVEWKEAKSDIS